MTTEWVRRKARDYWAAESASGWARLPGVALTPLELPFRLAVGARNAWYERRPAQATPIPVVSVGNLTVGGSGKTPVTRWLGEWLRRAGASPAIVTRGYGADEVALHRRWFGTQAVFADRDRRNSVRTAADRGYRVAILDDGFQHRRLARTLDVLLVSVEDHPRARMLPRGPYRESLASARRATFILLTSVRGATRGATRSRRAAAWRRALARAAPGIPQLDVEIRMGGWRDLDGASIAAPQGDVVAVCAIARPGPFVAGLGALLPEARIEAMTYADHYEYGARDVSALLERLGDRTVVCTAKDAVKLSRFRGLAPRCAVVGFGVAGDPPDPLRSALATVAAR